MAFGQIFFARIVFLADIAVQQKMLGQKYFCQIWSGFLARNDLLARNVFLPNLIKNAYFSKYWKVWLVFNGWKLSGLFSLISDSLGGVFSSDGTNVYLNKDFPALLSGLY